jgi:hypothetical protein
MCVCMCIGTRVCVCVCERENEAHTQSRANEKHNQTRPVSNLKKNTAYNKRNIREQHNHFKSGLHEGKLDQNTTTPTYQPYRRSPVGTGFTGKMLQIGALATWMAENLPLVPHQVFHFVRNTQRGADRVATSFDGHAFHELVRLFCRSCNLLTILRDDHFAAYIPQSTRRYTNVCEKEHAHMHTCGSA